jgi:hypothetical protein
MGATIVDIADAVVESLNAATLTLGLAAVRSYLPVYQVQDLDELRVAVVPGGFLMALASRAVDQFDYTVDVAMHRRLKTVTTSPTATVDIDPYLQLAEDVVDLFRGKPLTLASGLVVHCTDAAAAPLFDPALLDQQRLWAAAVSLTFRTQRARP